MKKRFGRKLRETAVVIVVLGIILLVLWIVSHIPAATILSWLRENWGPTLVGFALSTIGGLLVDIFFGDNNKEK